MQKNFFMVFEFRLGSGFRILTEWGVSLELDSNIKQLSLIWSQKWLGAQKGAYNLWFIYYLFNFIMLRHDLSPAFAPQDTIKSLKSGFFCIKNQSNQKFIFNLDFIKF